MKTKAAVAARKPLEITTVDLDGPKAEFTRSGANLGHQGAGIVGVVVYS
jgi:hypothetical protein